jgi:hypothetical protein
VDINIRPIARARGDTTPPLNRYDVAALMLQYWWVLAVLWLLVSALVLWA